MSKGLVSVIVPVYNCEKYIYDCTLSLVYQSYEEVEIILVDDGSTDCSGEICLKLEKMFHNVHYLFQENCGAAVARNNGLEHANGSFIMFVDGDDQVKPDIIKCLIDAFEDDIDITCCSYSILGTDKIELMFPKPICASNTHEKIPFYLQLMDYTYGHEKNNATAIGVPWGKIFRKQCIDKYNLRFDPRLRRMQDNIFVMEAIYSARTVKYLPECLYLYRVEHINSYSSVSYSPEIYHEVLKSRDAFFNRHSELKIPTLENYLYKEHLNYLMLSIHYIVAKYEGDREIKIGTIKQMCQDDVYSNALSKKPNKSLSKKQLIQWCLYKLKMYSALYYSYKIKYRL